jgi:uncharacterized protein (DUF488 family)
MGKFVQLLKLHGITAICDVRSEPYSKHAPQFNYESIKKHLKNAAIEYIYLGKELGPRSENPTFYINGRVQYEFLAQSVTFKEGLERIKKGVAGYRLAIMCTEKDPAVCHRTILVCRQLRGMDFIISHILEDGSLEDNSDTERRLMKMLKIPKQTLFEKPEELLERAYDEQGHRIAYYIKTENEEQMEKR